MSGNVSSNDPQLRQGAEPLGLELLPKLEQDARLDKRDHVVEPRVADRRLAAMNLGNDRRTGAKIVDPELPHLRGVDRHFD